MTIHTAADAIKYLQRVAPDMPVFVLLGQDKLAPLLVESWAHSLVVNVGNRSDHLQKKIDDAKETARAMVGWPDRKLPD